MPPTNCVGRRERSSATVMVLSGESSQQMSFEPPEWKHALEEAARRAKADVIGVKRIAEIQHARLVTTVLQAFGDDPRAVFFIEGLPPTGNIPRPDLILLHPDVGVLVVENKGITLGTFHDDVPFAVAQLVVGDDQIERVPVTLVPVALFVFLRAWRRLEEPAVLQDQIVDAGHFLAASSASLSRAAARIAFRCPQHRNRDGQIQCGGFLFHISRRQVDEHGVGQKGISAVEDGPPNPLDGFLHGRLGQSHDGRSFPSHAWPHRPRPRKAAVDAQEDERVDLGEHKEK